jgi:hypothetical protein
MNVRVGVLKSNGRGMENRELGTLKFLMFPILYY